MNNILIKNKKQYIWWKDKKILGIILLIITIIMQIFAFIEVPIITTIHGYTIGMMFGYYNPLFYFYFIYIALEMMFFNKIKIFKWIKLTKKTYWFLVISIVMAGTSLGYYQVKNGFTNLGSSTWSVFKYWFNNYTNNESVSFWFPCNTNGGIIGASIYVVTSTILTGIGSMIITIFMLSLSIVFLVKGHDNKFFIFNKINGFKKKNKKNKEEEKTSKNIKLKQKENFFEESLPFEDPFDI